MVVKVVMRQWMPTVVRQLHQLLEMVEMLLEKGVGPAQVVRCPPGKALMAPSQLLLQLEHHHSRQYLPSTFMSMSHHPIPQLCRTGGDGATTLLMSIVHFLLH